MFKNLFRKNKPNYIKPRVNKALFYFWDCWDSERETWRLIDEEYKNESYLHQLHPVMKTLRLFPNIAGQISNGGFSQLYFNGYTDDVKECIPGLYEIGETKTADILYFSYASYCISGDEFNPTNTDFTNLSENDQIEYIKNLNQSFLNFDKNLMKSYKVLDIKHNTMLHGFYDIYYQTMQNIVEHICAHPNEYVVDEDGKPFNTSFTGIYTNPNDKGNYELPMENGKPHGFFKIIKSGTSGFSCEGEFEHGFLKRYQVGNIIRTFEFERYQDTVLEIETNYYKDSLKPKEQSKKFKFACVKHIGKQKEWYESGAIKSVKNICCDDTENHFETYYENGQLESKGLKRSFEIINSIEYYENGHKMCEEYLDERGLRHAEFWYKDGSLHGYTAYDEEGNYIEHRYFYKDGSKKSEHFVGERDKISPRNYWDEQGKQTLKNGTGTIDLHKITKNHKKAPPRGKRIINYKDGVKHGQDNELSVNGVLRVQIEYKNGNELVSRCFNEEGSLTEEFFPSK